MNKLPVSPEFNQVIYNFFLLLDLNIHLKDNNLYLDNSIHCIRLDQYNKKLSYHEAVQLWNNFTLIITYLEKNNISPAFIDLQSCYIINNEYIVITDHFCPLANNSITISTIYSKHNPFISPELTSISSLPSTIPKQSCYYSVARIILKLMFFPHTSLPDSVPDELNYIYASKLYWLLFWCFDTNPKNRFLLIII